jgi:hypothetical protein
MTEREGGFDDTDDMIDTCVSCVSDTSMVLLKITDSSYETAAVPKEERRVIEVLVQMKFFKDESS